MTDKLLASPDDGRELEDFDEQLTDDEVLEHARKESGGYLFTLKPAAVGKFIKERWTRMDKQARAVQNELRVNFLRYNGEPFAQVHPANTNRVFIPANAKTRLPPSINKIKRTVHRYVAQITADEPVLEGVPAAHNDDARDQAESSTHALRGEWERVRLNRKLQRVQEAAAVMRSGFWFFEWDPSAGGKVKAQKFFKDSFGKDILGWAGKDGKEVATASEASEMWQGEITCEVLFPFNVRWSGAGLLEDADEVFVGKVISLRQLYEAFPDTKDVKIKHLVGHVTQEMESWMKEIRGAGGIASRNSELSDSDLEEIGSAVEEKSSRLDEPVLIVHYFIKPCRAYPKGYHGINAGEWTVYSGKLRYGIVPVAQFRCMDDLRDPLGFSLVDLLKDPQELMNFVNGQVLRFLQMMKRRWFVPLTSGVNGKDLTNPTRSLIYYNAQGGAPTAEQVPEIPATMIDFVDRFNTDFDDQSGIHETMQGKHVAGVSSGRHAEALRSGDETILGLTRSMVMEGLECAGRIMLAMMQKEWNLERKVAYFHDRVYLEKAFSNADFGATNSVRLKKGTLLMLTPAQRMDTIFQYAEMGALQPNEVRELAPLVDTAGISLTEDPHYIKARREDSLYLEGPPPKLLKARKAYEEAIVLLESNIKFAARVGMASDDPAAQAAAAAIQQDVAMKQQGIESEWQAQLQEYTPDFEEWEATPAISGIHFDKHSGTLASRKTAGFPPWWVQTHAAHTLQHLQALAPPPEEGVAPAPQ